MKPVKKLTTKHMFGGPKGVLALFPEGAKNDDSIHLCDVLGIANKVRRDESTMGEFSELQGDFLGVLPDGTRFQSGKCFIPDGAAHDLTVNAVENSDGEVEFGWRIGVIRDDTSASGYRYTSEPLTEAKESDRMAALLEKTGVAGALTHQPEKGDSKGESSSKKAGAKK